MWHPGSRNRLVLDMLPHRPPPFPAINSCGEKEGDGVDFEASLAMMTVSDVGDASLVEVVSSSLACLWDSLGMFVDVKSELRWQGLCGQR